jgi:hypothetical protein
MHSLSVVLFGHPVFISPEKLSLSALSHGAFIPGAKRRLGVGLGDGTMMLRDVWAGPRSLGAFILASNQPVLGVSRLVMRCLW